MNLMDPLPMLVWSFALYLSVIGLVLEWQKRDGVRRRVGLWISLRIHALRDRLGELEDLVDEELVRA